jgi:hypothetical protein
VLERAVTVHKTIERYQFRELATEDFGMATEEVCHDQGGLLILRKIAALEEAARTRRIHEEVRRPVELNH